MTEEQKLAMLLAGPVKPKGTPPEVDPTVEIETTGGEEHPHNTGSVGVSSVTGINLFRNPDAHPIVLDLCLLHKYGAEWYGWEPETLEIRIPQDFRGTGVSELNLAKVQACKALHSVDTFWNSWEIFLWCTMSLNGLFPDFETMQVPNVAQCAVAVEIANQIRTDVAWSSEVKAYLSVVHQHDGIFMAQPPLEFVSVPADGIAVNVEELRMLWPAVKASNKMPTADTVTAEQLRRLLGVYRSVKASRDTLHAQLPLVQHV